MVMDRAAPGLAKSHGRSLRKSGLPILVAIFIIGLIIPLILQAGPLRLTIFRIILLILFFPSLYILLSGKAGKLRLPDICVILICFWSSLSFVENHGLSSMVETIGILLVETLGAYMVGRCFIRTPEAFFATAKLLFWLVMLMLPFAIYEAYSGQNMILRLFGLLGQVRYDNWMEPRLGLDRVQGPFAHPIHFGVFCGSIIGLAFYVLGHKKPFGTRLLRALLSALTGAAALSSGPLAALMAQLYFVIWDQTLSRVKSRWYILSGLGLFGYFFVDALSNRSPFAVFITYFAFNQHTAYNRIYIWRDGTDNIWENPIFGLGYHAWKRVQAQTDSVDMFWIVHGMRHGIPVWILFFALFFSIFLAVAYRKNLGEKISAYRLGYLCTMSGLFMAGWTVHYWEATFAYFMFLLGAGVWFLDYDVSEFSEAKESSESSRNLSYSRFPPSDTRSSNFGSGAEFDPLTKNLGGSGSASSPGLLERTW